MKVALIYMSRHGITEKIVWHIAKCLSGDVHVFNLADTKYPDIEDFDSIVIGGSIHYGSIQQEVQTFCRVNSSKLIEKRLGLFLCCLLIARDSDQFERAYPLTLRAHCCASAVFEGDLVYSKLNVLERLFFNPSKRERDVIRLNENLLEAFVYAFSKEDSRTFTPYIPSKS